MSEKAWLMAEAMGYLDESYIEEAHCEAKGVSADTVQRKKTVSRIALVACLCLVALGISRIPHMMGFNGKESHGDAAPAPEGDGPMAPGIMDDEGNVGNSGSCGSNDYVEDEPMAPGETVDGSTGGTETEAENDTESGT